MNHSDIDQYLTGFREPLIILAESAVTPQPTKGPLHNPPSPVYLEPCLTRTLTRHLQNPPAMTPNPSQLRSKERRCHRCHPRTHRQWPRTQANKAHTQ